MNASEIVTIAAPFAPRSLHWQDGQLVDWVSGSATYALDGSYQHYNRAFAYPFDAAVISPSGRFQAIYQKLGTKGVLMSGETHLREINRSYYHADVYEYPIALFRLPNGRELMAHCPDEYCKLEIEDIATGERLTQRDNEPADFFHSRLAVSADGKYLLSAGWIWHPFDWVKIFNIEETLTNPARLDANFGALNSSEFYDSSSEINSACFLSDNELLLYSSQSAEDFDEGEPDAKRCSPLRPGTLGRVDLASKTLQHVVPVAANLGTFFTLDEKHVLDVYEHPKVVDVHTGIVLHEWPELKTGLQNSSIIHHIEPVPPMAFDPKNRRFAVADAEAKTIKIITIPESL